ncbi:MAG: hypothetical protein AB7D51_15355 [Desulfovibrionaceae bacterium]
MNTVHKHFAAPLAALALAAVLLAALVSPSFAFDNPFAPEPGERGSVVSMAQAQTPASLPEPQGSGLRGVLPLILVVGVFLLLRRVLRNMGGDLDERDERDGRDRPGGQGHPFDHPRDEQSDGGSGGSGGREHDRTREDFPADDFGSGGEEHMKDAYDNARRMWDAMTGQQGGGREDQRDSRQEGQRDSQRDQWNEDRREPSSDAPPRLAPVQALSAAPSGTAEGFDEEEFLAGAVLAFARINEAVDRLDTLTLQDFAAPEIVNAVKVRINADEARVESEVDRVSGRVLEHAAPGPDTPLETVTVHLEGRRRTKAGTTRTLRSVWRFERNTNDPEPRWILASMRPVEA